MAHQAIHVIQELIQDVDVETGTIKTGFHSPVRLDHSIIGSFKSSFSCVALMHCEFNIMIHEFKNSEPRENLTNPEMESERANEPNASNV